MTRNDTYHRPRELGEALKLLASGSARVAAGCTDLFPATERKVLDGPILDITGIDALRGITKDDTGITIGATSTWSDLQSAALPPAFDGLKLAAREVGARQIQNRGTIAGNLCNASPAADGVPPLLTLDASVILQSERGARTLPLAKFMTGPRRTALAADELLTALHIPPDGALGNGHFLKLGARTYLVISIAMTAARIVVKGGVVKDAALAIGACAPTAIRLPEAEAALIGRPPEPSLITAKHLAPHLAPIDDMRADAGYRITAALELLRRTLAPFSERQAA